MKQGAQQRNQRVERTQYSHQTQGPPQPPPDLLLNKIEVRRCVAILARKRKIGDAPHHASLFDQGGEEKVFPVQHSIRASDEENDSRHDDGQWRADQTSKEGAAIHHFFGLLTPLSIEPDHKCGGKWR